MSIEETVKTLHPFEIRILNSVQDRFFTIAAAGYASGLSEAQARSGVNWLEGRNYIAKKEKTVLKKYTLTEKGREFQEKQLPELAIYEYVKSRGKVPVNDLMGHFAYDKKDIGSAFGHLKKNRELVQQPDGTIGLGDQYDLDYYQGLMHILEKFRAVQECQESEFSSLEIAVLARSAQVQLHKGLFKVKESETFSYELTEEGRQVRNFLLAHQISGEEISQVTPEILLEKKWRDQRFRHYNIQLPAPRIQIGRKHPYRDFLDFLKQKFIGLGFAEMRGPVVETEFWNMDALFMPQTHPARDIHDIYYIREPRQAGEISEPTFSAVARTHENGDQTGSRGWGYVFNREKARQLILRSQGTVLSAKTLAGNPQIPGKYFSIARCFRYDKVDATHLADFYQVEGIVLSETADFPTLLGLLKLFASEIARAKEIKYVPGYFPFTEPSVEVHIKHPRLGWYELGGAGIFRPEVTLPLGVKVPVLAWGLGVDRMAMMALGINDIRDLFSRDLDLVRQKRMVM